MVSCLIISNVLIIKKKQSSGRLVYSADGAIIGRILARHGHDNKSSHLGNEKGVR